MALLHKVIVLINCFEVIKLTDYFLMHLLLIEIRFGDQALGDTLIAIETISI